MSIRDFEHTSHFFAVTLHGQLLAPNNKPPIDQGLLFGTQPSGYQASIMRLPKSRVQQYTCALHETGTNVFFDSDAVLLTTSRQSVAFATSDCGATILFAKNTGDVMLVHTGRNQLMDKERPRERISILKDCIDRLLTRSADKQQIRALSIGQIPAQYFDHRGHPYEAVIRAQADVWGDDIIPDHRHVTLDLVQLISTQLIYYGIPARNMARIRLNPITSPDLSSKRGGKPGSNVITLCRP